LKEDGNGIDTIMSVVVCIDNTQIAISTYKRKQREVINKIKKAERILYIKVEGSQPDERA
jgi:hypothetical protein